MAFHNGQIVQTLQKYICNSSDVLPSPIIRYISNGENMKLLYSRIFNVLIKTTTSDTYKNTDVSSKCLDILIVSSRWLCDTT